MIGKRYVVFDNEGVLVDMRKVKGTDFVSQDIMAERIVTKEFGLDHSTIAVKGQARKYCKRRLGDSLF